MACRSQRLPPDTSNQGQVNETTAAVRVSTSCVFLCLQRTAECKAECSKILSGNAYQEMRGGRLKAWAQAEFWGVSNHIPYCSQILAVRND